jgi:hypothetical protein
VAEIRLDEEGSTSALPRIYSNILQLDNMVATVTIIIDIPI